MLWLSICFGICMKRVWIWIGGISASDNWFTLDMIVLSGVCFLTVYAQFFSLFYKVGLMANLILAIISILCFPIVKTDIKSIVLSLKEWKYWWWLIILLILGTMLLLASLPDSNYDTPLYHAQAIRWIEEYGVVKGLGLLHSRLAFNSSFLSLQALFGYGYITGIELHSCNAFLMFIFHIWAIRSLHIWKNRKFVISDAFKLLMLFYIYTCTKDISSPSTDIFAVAMIIYILAKWMELIERGEYSARAYTYLSFFVLYSATLKLSAAPFGLIVIYPLYLIIKEKNFAFMRKAMLIGIVIVLPFLIRNIILSGWLLYPLPTVDFFDVDWKIPREYAIREKLEIETWGKSLTDIGLAHIGINEWFPLWFQWVGRLWRRVICISIIMQAAMFVRCIYFIWDKHCAEYRKAMLFVYLIEFCILVIWFVTAPSIRFGGIFCMFAGTTLFGEFLNERKTGNYILTVITLLVILAIEYNIYDDYKDKGIYFIRPGAYVEYPVGTIQKDGATFYCPVEGDQTGYECFPSVPSNQITVGLRKYGVLGEGFRWD